MPEGGTAMLMVNYKLRVMIPEYGDLAEHIRQEILEDAEPHDTTDEDRIRRYLGGAMTNVENSLSSELPEGWYAKVEDQ